jgi:hypothetical protein
VIRTMLTLKVDPTRIGEVLDYYRAHDVLQYSLDHSDAVASEISVAADGSGEILVTALWPDADAYQGWIDNPWRERSNERLGALLRDAEIGPGRVFEIDHDVRTS